MVANASSILEYRQCKAGQEPGVPEGGYINKQVVGTQSIPVKNLVNPLFIICDRL